MQTTYLYLCFMNTHISSLEALCEMLNSNPDYNIQELIQIIDANHWINQMGNDDHICTDCSDNLLYFNRDTQSHSIQYSSNNYLFLSKEAAIFAAQEFAERNDGYFSKSSSENGTHYFEIQNTFKIMYDTTLYDNPNIVDIIYIYSNKFDSIIGLFAYPSDIIE